MPRSAAKSVDEYLDELPEDRREVVAAMRKLVRKHIPKGYEEAVNWGMLCWQIPLASYPTTYNGQPLGYVALATQKNYCALYLLGAYMVPAQTAALKDAFAKAGKKLDMGKSCLRFRTLDDLPLPALGELIASMPPAAFIAAYEANRPAKKTTTSRAKSA